MHTARGKSGVASAGVAVRRSGVREIKQFYFLRVAYMARRKSYTAVYTGLYIASIRSEDQCSVLPPGPPRPVPAHRKPDGTAD